jgi:hypothetical protein
LADSLVLSFYWQARGWGEQPNADDSLMLQFKNSSGQWVRQWAISVDSLTPFTKQDIVLRNSAYIHSSFQFRFLNFGRLSGAYDTWNIDYVYLNARAAIQRPGAGIVRDVAFVGGPISPIKNYSQIPLSQYQESLKADSISAFVRNVLGSPIGDNVTHLMQTNIYVNQQLAKQFTDPASSSNALGLASSNGTILLQSGERVRASIATRPLQPWLSGDSAHVVYNFFLSENAEGQNAIDTKTNDTLSYRIDLGHAFAYDDGSAEFGWGINKKFGKFAYQFEAFKAWEMNAVDIHIAKVGRKLTQGGFRIGIYQSIDTANSANDKVLLAPIYFPIAYTEVRDGMQRLYLGQTVSIPQGKFYMIVEQLTDELLPIGFDTHRNSTDQMWVNLGGTNWKPVRNFSGSLMLRPVQEPSSVTGLPEELAKQQEDWVYPNPSNGHINWHLPIEYLAVYNTAGLLVFSAKPAQTQQSLQLSKLPSGLYLLKIEGRNGETYSQRILLED